MSLDDNIMNAKLSKLDCVCPIENLEHSLSSLDGVRTAFIDEISQSGKIEFDKSMVDENEIKSELEFCGCKYKWDEGT